MQGSILSKICNNVVSFFNHATIEIDKTTKFAKRKSKLTASLFVETLVMGCISDSNISLERMCRLLKQKGIKISKQGLHQRFTSKAVLLMQELFKEACRRFKTETQQVLDLLKPFSGVHMIDGTGITLPKNLKENFKGYGGNASEAAMKIQLMLNYVEGQIEDATITSALKSDQSFTEHLNTLQKGALYLQDLGYFKIDSFNAITAAGALFSGQSDQHFASQNSYSCFSRILSNLH